MKRILTAFALAALAQPALAQPAILSATVAALVLVTVTRTHAADPPAASARLTVPAASDGKPAAGRRVRQQNDDWLGSEVHHLLYLPTDWKPGSKYPVIVEYAGNKWRTSPGTVQGSSLGYGVSRGEGVIWICMPFVNKKEKRNQETWWGDVEATVAYCQQTVQRICREYGGDANNLFIAGFSRGAIACNYIGLHNNSIAALWKGFICHSHYDGVRQWNYAASDRKAARQRLQRLGSRPQFISHENSVTETQKYLKEAYPQGNFTFVALPGTPHTCDWVLSNSPQRKQLRQWFAATVKQKQQ